MKVLLFDLGGVVINWTGLQEMQKLLGDQYSLEEIRQKIISNPISKQHGIGQCSTEEFAESFVRDFNLPFEPQEFADIYASWAGIPYPGVFDRLSELRADYTLACLSNTNALHWSHLTDTVGIGDIFDHCYASHLLQIEKPNPKIFQDILADLGKMPGEVCFFDDAPENIDTARGLGMKVCSVDARVGALPHLENISYF